MVLLGGGFGSLTRYVVANAILGRVNGRFPWGTVFINITGSFLIGLLMTVLTEGLNLHPNWRLLLMSEQLASDITSPCHLCCTLVLVREEDRCLALLNVVGSLAVGDV